MIDRSTFTATTSAGSIAGSVVGDGSPVLLLHGGPGLGYDYMLPLVAELETDFRVAIFLQRGLEPSTVEGPFTIARAIEDVVCVLDALGWSRAWMVGHSWGGHLALRFAAAHPARLLGILAVVLAIFSLSQSEDFKLTALAGAAVVAAVAIIFFLRSWFLQWTTETVVTDKRIIHKLGFIARHTQEMNITKVETVDVFQGFWGRILGYGTVRVVGTGATLETLPYVASPLQLRNAIIVG